MKPTPALFLLRPCLAILTIFLALQPTALISARSADVRQWTVSAPQPAAASATSCQWSYYPVKNAKLQPELPLFNDPDNTPVANLSLGNPYKGKTAQLANSGSIDFDGDNKTDVLRTVPRSDGNLQWQYSSGGTAAWQNLAYAGSDLTASQMQFGNFNGDTKSDVFANLYDNGSSVYRWLYSSGGVGSFSNLKATSTYPNRLALGDFNGDGVTDVFTATSSSGTYQWAYSAGGTAALANLAFAATDPSLLRFGDFNGDGTTDVFAAAQAADGSTQWLYSSGGAGSYTNLASTTVPYSELLFGDFDGDGKSDVLAALPQSNGTLQVVYWPGGLAPSVLLGSIPAPAPALRVGDFNGDGISDLLALRCGMAGPLAFAPLQTVATSGFSTYNQELTGDVNGDGQADMILVSTCQNLDSSGICASHRLQAGTALGTSTHSFSLVAPQQLGADSLDFTYYKAFSGDYNGDGRTDLAMVYPTSSGLTVYVAFSNGDGTFTLNPVQTFAGDWNSFNPVTGDFNGDGKADLAFETVCLFTGGSCSNGDTNSVYVASSTGTGAFTMSARQDMGPASGWDDYISFVGDFNGDGRTDLLFNSTCQKTNFVDSTCTAGDANLVYTALSNGLGGFNLSAQQVYGASGWADYPYFSDTVGDVNGDGRPDLVWSSSYQAAGPTNNNLVVAGLANPDGTLQLGPVQNFGSAWAGRLSLADLNQDGRADLLWNTAPLSNGVDVDLYAAATSNGDGSFTSLGQGSVYTGQGSFQLLPNDDFRKVPSGLTLLSTRQDSISNALFVVVGSLAALNLKSVTTQDGWVLESGEKTNLGGTFNAAATTIRLGDDATRKQYRGILSFNTSGLPDNAVISSITLKVMKQSIAGGGNPVAIFKGFMADIKKGFFGTVALQPGDFQALPSKSFGPFTPVLVGNWYSIDLTSAQSYINKLTKNSGLTQIRLRFKLDDNNNTIANYLSLFSGNAPAANRPQLIITYYLP